MRTLLFQGVTRSPLTEPPPKVDDAELAALAARLDAAARHKLGRSLSIREVEQSLALLAALARLPGGPVRTEIQARPGEGIAIVEGFRGDILASVRIGNDGKVARCHLRDPSWFQWPLLEAVIEGNIVADFPLCNKSFNCSYSGHDL